MNPHALTTREVSTLYEPLRVYPYLPQLFEDIIHALYSAYLRPGDLCVDGGANQGFHTIPMAQLIGHGKVHAFEPIPELAEILSQNATQAHVRERIEMHICALADTEGVRDFVSFYNPSDLYPAAYSGLRKKGTPEEWPWRITRTPVTTLDASLSSLNGLRFIKLDLEGGEYHALSGGKRIIESQRPLIVFESGRAGSAKAYEYDVDEFFELFERLGYELTDILGTEMTRELWKHEGWIPWYFAALPGELGRPNWVASSVNAVLKKHRFPPLYTTLPARGRRMSVPERTYPWYPVHPPVVPEYTVQWKFLARFRQIARYLSPINSLRRLGRILRRGRVPMSVSSLWSRKRQSG